MSIVSRFVDAEVIHQQIERCPLAAIPPRPEQSACAGCPYNLAFPGKPRVGCIVNTPREVFARALEALEARSPALCAELEKLRAGGAVEGGEVDPLAQRWMELAEAWYRDAQSAQGAGEEVELSMVIARFARAAMARGEPVEILR